MDQSVTTIEPEKPNRKSLLGKVIISAILLVLLLNVIVLDFIVVDSSRSDLSKNRLEVLEKDVSRLKSERDISESSIVTDEKEEVTYKIEPAAEATATVIEREKVIERIVKEENVVTLVKEFYIPLGRASVKTEKFTWIDTGAEAKIDLSNYSSVKEVTFEATMAVPAGQVEARLYNVSDGYEVGGSRLIGDGSTPVLYSTGNISLPSGMKTYRVQMRTSLNYSGEMDNARIHIVID